MQGKRSVLPTRDGPLIPNHARPSGSRPNANRKSKMQKWKSKSLKSRMWRESGKTPAGGLHRWTRISDRPTFCSAAVWETTREARVCV